MQPRVPFLEEEAFQWYPSFDQLGELINRPNPTPALDLVVKVLNHLTVECAWPSQRIHLFGFAQGGTVAAETGLMWWKLSQIKPEDSPQAQTLGSIVTVSGPLISYPTMTKLSPTPLLVFHRTAPSESALPSSAMAAFKKGYSHVKEIKIGGDGMPRSKDEWEGIMTFWSERLGRRLGEDMYEVVSGGPK